MKSSNATIKRMQKFMVEKVAPVSNKISNEPHLAALRDGLVNLIPIQLLVGSQHYWLVHLLILN